MAGHALADVSQLLLCERPVAAVLSRGGGREALLVHVTGILKDGMRREVNQGRKRARRAAGRRDPPYAKGTRFDVPGARRSQIAPQFPTSPQ